ncbi:MAG: hypothetical protein HC811_13315 [Flammeovirgaceae bacterium]|nr:hypothetical protein [Flammeovirgaceae bacterium]
MINKLSEEQGILRQTMLFTGLEVCAYNINRKQKDLKLFEFGKIYSKSGDKPWPYRETAKLGVYMTGNSKPENWQNKSNAVSFYDLNQQVSQILVKCAVNDVTRDDTQDPLFDYGLNLTSGSGKLGVIGKVKSTIQKEFGIKQEIFFAELDTALLFNSASPKLVIQEVPRFPDVRRDLSLVIDKSVRFRDIEELVASTEKRLIKELTVFDVYEGDNIPKNKKAYALAFIMRDEKKTLTDEEVDATMNKLMGAFEKKLGAMIRK